MQLYTKILLGMLVGVLLGLLVGPNSPLLPQDGARLMPGVEIVERPATGSAPAPMSRGVDSVTILERRAGEGEAGAWLRVEWQLSARQLMKRERERERERAPGPGAQSTAPTRGAPGARHEG
ncbi:MAG: hypothetical protein KC468_04250, partial [Myxococcales bacterium]|nr:hypothetical protein [Myxococcales bacterium]